VSGVPAAGEPGEGGLKPAAVSGVRWTSLAQFARFGLQLASTLVLAALLPPDAFGLVGMAAVVIGFVALFRDLGTGAAVIQQRDLDEATRSTVFWVNVVLGLVAGAALFAAATPVALFYGEPRLVAVMRALAFALPIAGPGVVPLAILQRELAFRRIARVEVSANLIGVGTGIAAALAGAGVWSLVLQALVTTAVQSGMGLLLAPFQPRLAIRTDRLREVLGYGAGLTGFQVTHWLTRNVDQLLIGRVAGATALGYYALAIRLVFQPLLAASGVVGRVVFPLYARIQDDPARIRHAYLRVTAALAIVLFPALAGMGVVSGPLVEAFFGPKWGPAAPIIAILATSGLLIAVGTTVGPVYQATGRTDLLWRWGLASMVVQLTAFAVGIRWGPVGVACAHLVATALLIVPGLWIPLRLIGLDVGSVGKTIVRPAVATLIMVLFTVVFGRLLVGRLDPWPHLIAVVACGVVSYVSAILLLDRARAVEMTALLLRGRMAR
jgi:PST family polysaccharide transporter